MIDFAEYIFHTLTSAATVAVRYYGSKGALLIQQFHQHPGLFKEEITGLPIIALPLADSKITNCERMPVMKPYENQTTQKEKRKRLLSEHFRVI